MHSTTSRPESGRARRSVEICGRPPGVELTKELRAPFLFVSLADRRRGSAQSVEGAQEPAVLRVRPAHVSRAAPAVRPQPIEPAVVAGAKGGVGLDVVACRL